ncbi:MAG: NUDIX domain-containing protein [Chloroflexota bacterium]|nr:NUDIX domain-containing protein [Chloroflexota bacterium]
MTAQSFGLDKSGLTQEHEEEEGRFLVAVGAMIEHAETGRILLLKRSEDRAFLPGVWEDIGGRIKQFEEPEHALRREVQEESGLDIQIVKPVNVFHLFHGERSAGNEMIIITYWCRSHSDRVVLSHEHSEYRWLLPTEALRLVEHEGVRSDIEAWMMERSRDKAQ